MAIMPHAPVVPFGRASCDDRGWNEGAWMKAATGACAIAMLAFIGTARSAGAADIHVYSTGAPAMAAKAVGENFATATGHHLIFTVGQPATIESDLDAGALRAGSVVDLARVGIGVVVRNGASAPDISNAAAIRKLLLDARSVVYPDPTSGGGSAGRAIARMIEEMGLTETIRPKLTRASAIGGGVALVAGGNVEVGLFNISEILPIQGVQLVGPLPVDLQSYIVFSAAVPVRNTAPEPASAFIQALAAPAARDAWRNAGMEPIAGTR
jgi:molybdate transport system substrate-binding protein